MDIQSLHDIVKAVAKGDTSVEEAVDTLSNISCEDIEYAHIDHHRSLRKGFPEVVYGQGKTVDRDCGMTDTTRICSLRFHTGRVFLGMQ